VLDKTYIGVSRVSQSHVSIEISHPILHKHRLIKGEDKSVVERKARTQLAQWEAQRDRREEAYDRGQEKLRSIRAKEKLTNEREAKKALAIERTQDAQEEIDRLSKLLAHTLGIDDAIDWDSLKPNEKYSIKKPQKPSPAKIPAEPQLHDIKYQPKRSLIDYIFSSFWQRKLQRAKLLFASDHESWERVRTESLASGKHKEEEYRNGISEWEIGKRDFDTKQQEQGAAIERQRELYLSKSPEAITDYCDLVLSASQYPDYFPQEFWLSFDSENGQLIVDYLLPAAASIPTLKQVKYVQTRDDFDEVHLRESELNSIYDALCYQRGYGPRLFCRQADACGASTKLERGLGGKPLVAHSVGQWSRDDRQSRARLVTADRIEDPVHCARQPMGEWLQRKLQRQTQRRITERRDLLQSEGGKSSDRTMA